MGEGEGIGLRGEKETEGERRGKGTEGREGRKGESTGKDGGNGGKFNVSRKFSTHNI